MKTFFFLTALLWSSLMPVKADVLVLVHGYMSDARSWDLSGVNPVLAANGWRPGGVLSAFPYVIHRNPVSITPGNKSYSVNLPSAAPLAVQAGMLAQLLHTVRGWHPDERLVLAGHSAGGVVARMQVLNGNPFDVSALVTIASPNLGTVRAAQGLDLVDAKPFFCPGPGIDMLKSFFGGDRYDYLAHSRAALIDLLPVESGNLLAWLNQQAHANIDYYAIIRGLPDAAGDPVVPAYSQDMNNVPALRGRVKIFYTPSGHSLNPRDGYLLASLLTKTGESDKSVR